MKNNEKHPTKTCLTELLKPLMYVFMFFFKRLTQVVDRADLPTDLFFDIEAFPVACKAEGFAVPAGTLKAGTVTGEPK